MIFSTADPPSFKTKRLQFDDTSISIDRCFYYLSLLERFVETTQDMPESMLKLYLVRSEYRYYKWTFSSLKESVPPLGEC